MQNELLEILFEGSKSWNSWRSKNPKIIPSIRNAVLFDIDLSDVNLERTILDDVHFDSIDLSGANLSNASMMGVIVTNSIMPGIRLDGADLYRARLFDTNMQGSSLDRVDLMEAIMEGVDLRDARLTRSFLYRTNLAGANLSGADLLGSSFIDANLEGANLSNCRVYGVSVWGTNLNNTDQSNLIVSPHDEPTITVSDLDVAQFIYLLLSREKIRNVIDVITTKVILILGRFTPGRKIYLDVIRDEMLNHGYVPVIFDFSPPQNRDLTETIQLLASMSYFVIADLTDARSIPQELQVIIPNLPSVPIQPLIVHSQNEYGMFEHYDRYPWILPIRKYKGVEDLLDILRKQVIKLAEETVIAFRKRHS